MKTIKKYDIQININGNFSEVLTDKDIKDMLELALSLSFTKETFNSIDVKIVKKNDNPYHIDYKRQTKIEFNENRS